jgi:hypothetical protein
MAGIVARSRRHRFARAAPGVGQRDPEDEMLVKETRIAIGIDYAVGPEQSAVYFIVGSTWRGL